MKSIMDEDYNDKQQANGDEDKLVRIFGFVVAVCVATILVALTIRLDRWILG